jgi:hypothetical protein
MGIRSRLTQQATTTEAKSYSPNGSIYAPNYIVDGALPISKLVGDESPLHATRDGKEGYSLNGNNESDVRALYNEYDDGMGNALPPISTLDNPKAIEYTDLQTLEKVTVLYTPTNTYEKSFKQK